MVSNTAPSMRVRRRPRRNRAQATTRCQPWPPAPPDSSLVAAGCGRWLRRPRRRPLLPRDPGDRRRAAQGCVLVVHAQIRMLGAATTVVCAVAGIPLGRPRPAMRPPGKPSGPTMSARRTAYARIGSPAHGHRTARRRRGADVRLRRGRQPDPQHHRNGSGADPGLGCRRQARLRDRRDGCNVLPVRRRW